MFDDRDKTLRESLVGRSIVDLSGDRGKIISAEPTRVGAGCEVSVRFENNWCILDTRFDAQTWYDNSK
jgi:hypothetical protein